MSSLLGSLLSFVLLYKYAALFLITFSSSLALPIPSGALTVASFVFAGQGYMSTGWVALVATAGNVLGDLAGFYLARRYGRKVIAHLGGKKMLQANLIAKLENRVSTHPFLSIFATRLTTSITSIANLVAGFAVIGWRTFLIADLVGQGTETGLNFLYGRVFGETWAYVSPVTEKLGYIVIAFAVLLAAFFWRRRSSRRVKEARGQNSVKTL